MVTIFILCINIFLGKLFSQGHEINPCLLLAELYKKEVKLNDSVNITLSFINRTNDKICLYPNCRLLLLKPKLEMVFDNDINSMYLINHLCDLYDIVELSPHDSINFLCNIAINPLFFEKGLNTFYVVYAENSKKKQKSKRVVKTIISEEVSIWVH